MAQPYASGGSCCFTDRAPAVDPTAADCIVPAGTVHAQNPCGLASSEGCALATVYFPSQVYRAGYCPCEALSRGTLFPELVSDYPTCARGEV